MESYWDILPPEIKEMILKYKESQELIEWRESFVSRKLCLHIEAYGQLRRKWFIGPIQCEPRRPKGCQCRAQCSYIYGHYWDLNSDRKKVFLDFFIGAAIERCDSVKNRIWYQTNPSHSLTVCGMKLFL